jgi:ferritin
MTFLKPSDEIISKAKARLTNEYEAHFHYQFIANWCDINGYPNAAKYFKEEAETELVHAGKVMNWLNGWNITYQMPSVSVPMEIDALEDCLTQSYEIEAALWQAYNADAISVMETDTSAYDLFRKMLKIQTESVAEYRNLIDRYNRADGQIFLFESQAFS